MCTAVLIGLDHAPPPPPYAFGLIYEGAIGQPRYTTSPCGPLNYGVTRAVEYFSACESHQSTGEEDLPYCAITLLWIWYIFSEVWWQAEKGQSNYTVKKAVWIFLKVCLRRWRRFPPFCGWTSPATPLHLPLRWVYVCYIRVTQLCKLKGLGHKTN